MLRGSTGLNTVDPSVLPVGTGSVTSPFMPTTTSTTTIIQQQPAQSFQGGLSQGGLVPPAGYPSQQSSFQQGGLQSSQGGFPSTTY